jgi:acyl-CoA dehydrogenase
MRAFTEEQNMFRESYRRFLSEEIAPHMSEWSEAGIVDRAAFRKAGELGFLMVWPDPAYGGMGERDFRFEQIIIEESTRAGCRAFYNSLHSRIVGLYFERFGTEEQKRRFLPKCVTGETILAIAMTESGAGSDLAGMRTIGEDRGDHFLLNGSKTYISNGINADVVIVAAKLAGAAGRHAMVLLIVERGIEGFERGRNLKKMGMSAQDTAELFFKDVKVPKANVLGEPGKGFGYLMEGLAEERLIAAVGAAANARRAFDLTRDYVMNRKAFGKPLSEQQNTQFRMAELDARIDMIQVYVDELVARHRAGSLTSSGAAKGKLMATEIEWEMADLGVQLHGGAGYMEEYPICRLFRDARVNRILAGSSEIMRLVIGREIFSERYASLLR